MIRFACPSCNQEMEAGDKKAGTKLFCPRCGQKLQVPTPPPDPRKKTVLGKLIATEEPRNKTTLARQVPQPAPDGTRLVQCPHCKKLSRVQAEHLGKPVQCPHCKKEFAAIIGV